MAQLSGSDLNVKVTTDSDTRGIEKAEGKLGRFSSVASKAAAAARVLAAASLAVGTAVGGFALKAAADMETMNVALRTAFQGNEELAKQAGKTITQFAAKTPYAVGEVMRSFIKLKNMGLDPSQKALSAYGDTASAMGKSLNDMVEAVADAATGEFERLKEFGIRASSEGDRVKFTFQGVTTEVGKNSEEIERYLINLGKTKFAGGMEAQSRTLTGMLSTLGDTINITAAEFAESSGLFDVAKGAVEALIPIIENADTTISDINETFGEFNDWLGKNRESIEVTGAVIGTIMLPQMVAMAAQLTKNIGLWATHQLVSLAGNIKSTYMFVTAGWQTVAVLTAQGVILAATSLKWAALKTVQLATFILSGQLTAGFVAQRIAMLAGATATGIMTAAQWALNIAMRANPIGLIITALIALGGWLLANSGHWDTFKEKAIGAIKPVIDWISNLVGWIGKVTGLGGAVDAIKNVGKSLNIPGFAAGTNYAPGGVALVGERGPELVNLPRGSQVIPNQQTTSMLNRAGVVIENFHMNVQDSFDLDFGLDRLDRTLAARLG